jgi:hypothetical protein
MKLQNIIAIISWIAVAKSSYIQLPVIKKRYDEVNLPNNAKEPHMIIHNSNKLVKRDSSEAQFELITKFDQLMYEVQLEIGSNKDPVTLLLDTASSDLVVNSVNNADCYSDISDGDNSDDSDDANGLYVQNNAIYGDNIQKREEASTNFCPSFDDETSRNIRSKSINSSKTFKSYSSSFNLPASKIIKPNSSVNPTAFLSSDLSSSVLSAYPTLKNQIGVGGVTNDTIYEEFMEIMSCPRYGMFNENESTTLQNLSIPFKMKYGDGLGFNGYFVNDDIYYNGIKIPNTTFGVNLYDYRTTGILGVGFKDNESPYQNGLEKYDNFPTHLKNLGLIKKVMYSLYSLNKGSTNSILFGAYDKTGYVEESGLTLVPIINYSINEKRGNGPWYASITLNSISVSQNDEINLIAKGNAAVILDIGSTVSTVPYYIFNEILIKFNFQWSSQLQNYVINENDILKNNYFIIFNFQNQLIKLPLIYFTYPIIDSETLSETGLRTISILSTDNDSFILGDDFINNVYLIIDLEDKQVALGQANPLKNNSQDSIIVIENQIFDAVKSTNWNQIYGYNGVKSLKLQTIDDPNNLSTMSESGESLESYVPPTGNLGW